MAEIKGKSTVRDELSVDGNAKFNAGADPQYLEVVDQKGPNTPGGSFNASTWRTRDLNLTIHNDFATSITLAQNDGDGAQLNLPAGVYRISASAPAVAVGHHVTRLADVTTNPGAEGSTVVLGTVEKSFYIQQTRSFIDGRFTLSKSNTVLEIQHRSEVSQPDTGFGDAGRFYVTDNIFTIVKMWQVRDDS
jgi:hypothetical protein